MSFGNAPVTGQPNINVINARMTQQSPNVAMPLPMRQASTSPYTMGGRPPISPSSYNLNTNTTGSIPTNTVSVPVTTTTATSVNVVPNNVSISAQNNKMSIMHRPDVQSINAGNMNGSLQTIQ